MQVARSMRSSLNGKSCASCGSPFVIHCCGNYDKCGICLEIKSGLSDWGAVLDRMLNGWMMLSSLPSIHRSNMRVLVPMYCVLMYLCICTSAHLSIHASVRVSIRAPAPTIHPPTHPPFPLFICSLFHLSSPLVCLPSTFVPVPSFPPVSMSVGPWVG